ncbi:hypothetical protein SPRG_16333 [Saprolegnia parasitica CBS 223.65]|uniref:Uncharacterized protein n=1 Tax=Saprolegnia parasitica (strain CBS 223.65) TaxID=695850 RepID=A0A067BNC0_SAPPC|nr:hypothetical protein SPRG_16333 [Saprolegnia parasitica CBS 223.65]KDO18230.1 hypothetical protein SPRG_16333 [Saprolegnia parasitica CBS 223.65]|eukprot:XP_012211063.1 hypothetical protein SPRG_16333 [Saprolegnia parasitica CBS 223.65]
MDRRDATTDADEQMKKKKQEEEEAKDEVKTTSPARLHVPSVLDEADDKIEYRSIAAMAMPQQFGPGLGHMHQAPAFTMAAPAPFSARAKPRQAHTPSEPRIAMVDPTNYAKTMPKALPPPPFRLEMHSHFHVKPTSLQRLCMTIGQKLMDMGADFVFKAEKGKWKVSRVVGASRVQLNVTLFKAGAELVVEFQRRDGDIVSMMDMYGEAVDACKKQQLLSGQGATKPLKHKRPAPLTVPSTTASPTDLHVKDAVRSLQEMLTSKHSDVQLQGVLASISLATTPQYKDIMAALVPHLVRLTTSSDKKIVQCTSFALARLCDDPECRRAFINCDGWQVIMTMAAGGAEVASDLQRESLHILEILCPLYYEELANADGASAVLALIQEWESIVDPRLKKHACGAHRALQRAGLLA